MDTRPSGEFWYIALIRFIENMHLYNVFQVNSLVALDSQQGIGVQVIWDLLCNSTIFLDIWAIILLQNQEVLGGSRTTSCGKYPMDWSGGLCPCLRWDWRCVNHRFLDGGALVHFPWILVGAHPFFWESQGQKDGISNKMIEYTC